MQWHFKYITLRSISELGVLNATPKPVHDSPIKPPLYTCMISALYTVYYKVSGPGTRLVNKAVDIFMHIIPANNKDIKAFGSFLSKLCRLFQASQ